ncbi:MAG: hypothetical protein OHK0039_45200 [Bacteroidia bacterium]
MFRHLLLLVCAGLILGAQPLYSQRDTTAKPVVAFTFGGMALVNGHSVETLPRGFLDFAVVHRFSPVDGVQTFFGLDGTSNFRLGLAYGLSDALTLGVGRSRLEKRYDAFAKCRLLRQRTGGMPLSVSLLAGINAGTEPVKPGWETFFVFEHRLQYHAQVLLARKMGRLSLQLAPTLVHRNLTDYAAESNTVLALGVGVRYVLNPRMALAAEYYYRLNPGLHPYETYRDPLALSLDIETPMHRFQLLFTHAFALNEPGFIAQSSGGWVDGLRFGFNISRLFRP